MATRHIYLLILFCGLFSRAWPQSGSVLTAERNGRLVYLPNKMPVRVVVQPDSAHSATVLRGYLYSNGNGTIRIHPFDKSATEQQVSDLSAIQRLKPLSRRTRKTMLIALGGAAIYSGIIYVAQGKGGRSNGYSWIPYIPSMAVSFVFVYGFPLTYGFDWIREKKARKGWRFLERRY